VQKIVRCLLSRPLFSTGEIVQAVSDIRPAIADDGQHVVEGLPRWSRTLTSNGSISVVSAGPEHLSLRDGLTVTTVVSH